MTSSETIFNPYFIFSGVWMLALLIYYLGWSDLFPVLSNSLLLFFIVSLFFSLGAGKLLQRFGIIEYKSINYNKSLKSIFWFIVCLWGLQFKYSGIPLLSIIKGSPYNYQDFGIPSLKVFIATFTSFFSTYSFHIYLSTKSKKVLIYYLISISFYVLTFSRGMFLMTLSSSAFLLFIKYKKLNLRDIQISLVIALILSFSFGYVGNLRLSHSTYTTNGQPVIYNENIILELAKTNDTFNNNIIPNNFIWTYIYIASPIANLQHNITYNKNNEFNFSNVYDFIVNELLFDFISKRINSFNDIQPREPLLIVEYFTVSTVFAGSYTYLGWLGLIFMMLFILIFPILYLRALRKKNILFLTGVATLNSIYLYLFFDNMFTFSGLGLQLLYPLILGPYIKEVNYKLKHFRA